MGLLSRLFRPSAVKHIEGEYRPGPYLLNDGWLSATAGQYMNWWQVGHDLTPYGDKLAMVEACIGKYSQTIAMCPGDHWRQDAKGGRERVMNSALSRILRKPNAYQSASDFKLNLTRSLFATGNAYALAMRNNRYEISELHLFNPSQCSAKIALETGDIFYWLGGNEVIERQVPKGALHGIPARDVLHVKLAGNHPLKGESPLSGAPMSVAQAGVMTQQQLAFYANQSRPSMVLATDQVLTKEQIELLRERWQEHSKGLNAGGVPITAAGLKPVPLNVSAQDAQFAEVLKMTREDIALVFQIPLQAFGIGGSPFSSTEALMQAWRAAGLGFALDNIEQAFDRLFGLAGEPIEYTEFSTDSLLRSAMKERLEGLARGVQGGIYSPNEARLLEGLPEAEFGDEPRVQQQVVPLSAAKAIPSAPPAPSAPPQPAAGDDKQDDDDAGEREDNERDFAEVILAAARRHEQRTAV
jgi:HK97 family phage portal protein